MHVRVNGVSRPSPKITKNSGELNHAVKEKFKHGTVKWTFERNNNNYLEVVHTWSQTSSQHALYAPFMCNSKQTVLKPIKYNSEN